MAALPSANDLQRLTRPLRGGRWLVLVSAAALALVAYHALTGRYAIGTWSERAHRVDAAGAELDRLQEQKRQLDIRVGQLRPDSIDPDILDEEIRRLGYVRDDEVIILLEPGDR